MILDFKEIPKANLANGLQDTFELFARDFFEVLGYRILEQPDRGADGKKDLLIEESRIGLAANSKVKWLVSCKHFFHSGKSVSDKDEPNITDRVYTHGCDGFIGFYSTLPSASLSNNFKGLSQKMEIQSFDRERIEKTLLESKEGVKLARRYFPTSMEKYATENPKPKNILNTKPEIYCEYCNTNILKNGELGPGIFVLLQKIKNDKSGQFQLANKYSEAYFSCKGRCDSILKNRYNQHEKYADGWVDISKFLSPVSYISNTIGLLNYMSNGKKVTLEKNAFKKYKMLIARTFPFVARENTTKESEEIEFFVNSGLESFI